MERHKLTSRHGLLQSKTDRPPLPAPKHQKPVQAHNITGFKVNISDDIN